MHYRKLGKWGVKVSAVGVGSYLTIGMKLDEAASRRQVRAAFDAGINYFDTANAYNKGEAERMLGKCLAEFPRASVFVLTKVFAPMGPGPNDRGLSAKHIREQCEASLRRLGMDYVDLYMCHRPDPDTPLEETLRALEDLARQGKILYWGVSEWPSTLVQEAQGLARAMGVRPMAVTQPRYNLFYRWPERDLFPLTAREGIGNVVFSPVAHGMLTGKYKPGQPPPPGTRGADEETNHVLMNLYWTEDYKQKAQAFVGLAQEMGLTGAQLAVAWCLRRREVSSVILGLSRVEQLDENIKAVEVRLSDDVVKRLDGLFPAVEGIPTL